MYQTHLNSMIDHDMDSESSKEFSMIVSYIH